LELQVVLLYKKLTI